MNANILGLLLATAALVAAAPATRPDFKRGVNRIVGGSDATPGEIPYQVSIQDEGYGTNYHYCGGSIYDEKWILTAHYCVEFDDSTGFDFIQVVAGITIVGGDEITKQESGIEGVFPHEKYNDASSVNDIALISLATPLVLNKEQNVDKIALPEIEQESSGDCTVSGWGATEEGGEYSKMLQKVDVPIITDEECRKYYGDIRESMLCAGDVKNGGKDSCQGNSGSPLVCLDSSKAKYLAGIVSWGTGCGRPTYPGVYTEVSYFLDWINSTIGNAENIS